MINYTVTKPIIYQVDIDIIINIQDTYSVTRFSKGYLLKGNKHSRIDIFKE